MTKNFIVILCLTSVLSGCLSRRSTPARYYMLEYPREMQADTNKRDPVQRSCLIRPVEIHPAYSTHQIAVRERTHEIRYFAFNQWAVRPEQSLFSLLVDFISDHNIFSTLHTRTAFNLEPDFILETTIHHLVLVEEDKSYHARLSLEYTLRDFGNGEIVLNHRADRRQELEEKNLNLFASAVSEIFIEELDKFSNSILAEHR